MLRGIAAAVRTRTAALAAHRSLERRVGGWTVSLDLSPPNWTVGFWFDAPPALQLWFGPLGVGVEKADAGEDRSWDRAWTLARLIVGRTEFRLDADLNIWQFGVAFARGLKDFGVYLGPVLNVQVEHGVGWRRAGPNPLLRLRVPRGAPRWSILARRERAAALERAVAGRLDLARFAPADTGLDRPVWVARGAEVVVVPRRPGDRDGIGPGCVAVGFDQDTGCRDADRWLEANAYMVRQLSAGLIDAGEFTAQSWRVRGRGFACAR